MKLQHHILLVEDNDGDMILTMEAIQENNNIHNNNVENNSKLENRILSNEMDKNVKNEKTDFENILTKTRNINKNKFSPNFNINSNSNLNFIEDVFVQRKELLLVKFDF